MKVQNRAGIYAGLTSLVLVSAVAGTAFGQTKAFAPGTDSVKLTGGDLTTSQNEIGADLDSTGDISNP